jgi:hypothetical protein
MIPDPTPRDVLLARLLHAYRAIGDYEGAEPSSLNFDSLARQAGRALRGLNEAATLLDPSDPEQVRATAYGIPEWLTTGLHSVEAAIDLLTSPRGRGIFECRVNGRRGFDEDDFLQLGATWERLAAIQDQRLRLLPRPLGEPGHSFTELAQGLIASVSAPSLAAASSNSRPGTLRDVIARALVQPGGLGPVERELAARLLRVDVPLVHGEGRGVVLGLDVVLSRAGDERVHTRPVDRLLGSVKATFTQGVREGHVAALRLLERLGVAQERRHGATHLEFSIRGLEPDDMPVVERSAGLPVALHVLAAVLDLEPPAWTATGCLSETGELEDMEAHVAPKAAAVLKDGFRPGLAVRAPALDGMGGIKQLAGETLAHAAEQLWGDVWVDAMEAVAAAQRVRARQMLLDAGCSVALGMQPDERALLDDDGTVIGVQSRQHDTVLGMLEENPDTPVVLGGPPGAGKSWTVRSVVAELERDGWQAIVFRFRNGRLPGSELNLLVTAGLMAVGLDHADRVLIVLEDLEPYRGSNDLDHLLPDLLQACGHPVLAVTRAVVAVEESWIWDEVPVIRFSVNYASMVETAERLVAAFPRQLGGAAGIEGLAARASGGDLWWLVRVLAFIHRHPGGFLESGDLRTAFLEERTAGFDSAARRAAQLLAACSEIGLASPERYLDGSVSEELRMSVEQRGQVGAVRVPSKQRAAWILPSPEARFSLLRLDVHGAMTVRDGLQTGLDWMLARLLDEDLSGALELLQRAGVVFDGEVQAALLLHLNVTLVQRLCQYGTPVQLALALLRFPGGLERSQRALLVKQLRKLLILHGWSGVKVAGAISCLRALRGMDTLGESGADDPDEDDPSLVMSELIERLEADLAGMLEHASPGDALGLLREVHELRWYEHTANLLRELCAHALDGARAGDSMDIGTALELRDQARKIDSATGRAPNRRTLQEELVDSDGARRLLRSAVLAEEDAFTYLAQLVLRDVFAPATADLDPAELETQLRMRIPRTSAPRLTHGLRLIRGHSRHLGARFRSCDLLGSFDTVVERSAPLPLAHLIDVVRSIHPKLATRLLLQPDGVPRPDVLATFARRINQVNDIRTANHVLATCSIIDEEFGGNADGFAQLLAHELRLLFLDLPNEWRPSVVFNLVRGLIRARCEQAQLEELRTVLLGLIKQGFTSIAARAHAPLLALTLAEDEALGPTFIAELRIISSSVAERRMHSADTPEALAQYHRFALAVYPELCGRFAANWKGLTRRIVGRLRDPRTLSVLQALVAVGQTLSYGGERTAGQKLVELVEPDAAGWGRKLARIRKPGDLTQALNLLGDLDQRMAVEALEQFGRAGSPGVLVDRVAGPSVEPELGIELLATIHHVHPSLADDIAQRMTSKKGWQYRRRALVALENPSEQGQTLRRFAQLGLQLDGSNRRAIRAQWLDLAPYMRSPRSIGDLLSGLLPLDPDTAWSLTNRLDHARIAARIRRGRRGDAATLPGLLSALARVGREEIAAQLAVCGLEKRPARIDLKTAERLLGVVLLAAPESARAYAGWLQSALVAEFARSLLLDPTAHLWSGGWLARRLRLAGVEVPDVEPVDLPVEQDQIARLWALAWLPSTPSRRQEIQRLLDAAEQEAVPTRSSVAAALLIVAAHNRRAAALLGEEPDRWDHAFHVTPEWLTELVAEAQNDLTLRSWLAARRDDLLNIARRPQAAGDVHAAKLEEAAASLVPGGAIP